MALLQQYKHLQVLRLSHNHLSGTALKVSRLSFSGLIGCSCSCSDITVLGHQRYLIAIDVSHNRLKTVLGIDPPPPNLQAADVSYNLITAIGSLVHYRFLRTLSLSRMDTCGVS